MYFIALYLLCVVLVSGRSPPSPPSPSKAKSPSPSPKPHPSPPPQTLFTNLSLWSITLPVNASLVPSSQKASAIGVSPINSTFTLPPYFDRTPTRLTFFVPTNGAVTNSATDPRCEMRYDIPGRWNVTAVPYSRLTATISVDALPFRTDLGTTGNVIIAQLKSDSPSCELMKLTFSGAGGLAGLGGVYIEESPVVGSSVRNILVDSNGKASAIPFGSHFDYIVTTNRTHLTAQISYNSIFYSAVKVINQTAWSSPLVMYKTGAYCQASQLPNAPHPGTGNCTVSIYSLGKPLP